MKRLVARYRRVEVHEGKHGHGDYRVTFNGAAPTSGELLAMVHWVLMAEDRYNRPGMMGRAWMGRLIDRIYYRDVDWRETVRDADGPDVRAEEVAHR